MKALNNLVNTEKSKLLHDLFPDEIPQLLNHIQTVCADLKTKQEEYRATWDFGLMTFDMWLQLSEQVEERIKKYRSNMIKSSKVFSDQLFSSFDYTVLFVNDRIVKYAQNVSNNDKFKLAVTLIFTAQTSDMKKIKGIEQLREQLSEFEHDITESITIELKRIGRTVKMDEFEYIPFNEDIRDYIETIRLDEEQSPVLDTSFSDITEKYLSSFFSDGEIEHWCMISLLGMLMDIES